VSGGGVEPLTKIEAGWNPFTGRESFLVFILSDLVIIPSMLGNTQLLQFFSKGRNNLGG